MTQIATAAHASPARSVSVPAIRGATRFLIPIGRALLAAIFVMSGFTHFSSAMAGYAAAQGIPLARLAVPLSGILALLGGVSVLLGYRARVGAGLLLLFLVPVTLAMHRFWAVSDPMAAQLHMVMFMKNLGLMGGALMVAHFGAGPYSLDARREAESGRPTE